jgi:ParB family chromosome partitioning protein
MSKQPQQKSRLGRGLSSLIGMSPLPQTPVSVELPGPSAGTGIAQSPAAEPPGVRVLEVPLDKLSANPHQPRRSFDEGSLQSLADSLKATGLIQPVVARGTDDGSYELIAGERRWRAAKLAGLATIPVILRAADPVMQAQMALIENIQREDLNPIERAAAYKALLDNLGLTQAELADRLGEDRTVIGHHLRLLDLAPPVQEKVVRGQLSLSHARLLAGVAQHGEQTRLADLVLSQDLNVRNLERLINAPPAGQPTAAAKAPSTSAHIADLEKTISRHLGLRVQLRAKPGKKQGRLILHYASLDQFDDLLNKLGISTAE